MRGQVDSHDQALQPGVARHQQGQRQVLVDVVVVLDARPQHDAVSARVEGSHGLGKEAAPRLDAMALAAPGVGLVIVPGNSEQRSTRQREGAGGDGDTA